MKHGPYPSWRKSSYSGGDTGQCVELANLGTTLGVRDSTDPDGPVLRFGRNAVRRLVLSIKSGGFSHPVQDEE
ncbi:DUF397 domain-containing protein [Actinomadura sp. NAK00032]|uniref:DUF397 domain-containing protein n=1 Tax=Actinomadura sp. NAK00032 TaxID=2742128 RepID=UPI0015903947|nr:DUF397 domain-containing protein [Actinomadura sp. NAK00032]QKW33814.1 DUF397 domain-containing protein [Actinomadura sp. NAK00032]